MHSSAMRSVVEVQQFLESMVHWVNNLKTVEAFLFLHTGLGTRG